MGGKKKNQENYSKHENGLTSASTPKQEKVEAKKKQKQIQQAQTPSQLEFSNQNTNFQTKTQENKQEQQNKEAKQMESFRQNVISSVENRLLHAHSELELEISKTINKFNMQLGETIRDVHSQQYGIDQEYSQQKKKFYFAEKSFHIKNSMLSELFKISDYRTLYNIVVASFVALAINLVLVDYFDKGQIFDFETLQFCFSGALNLILPWLQICVVAYSVIPFVSWIVHEKIKKYIWIPIYTCYIALITFIGCYTCVYYTLGMGSAFIIQCEMVRIGMKMHSYLRNKLLYCTENDYKTFIPKEFSSKGFKVDDLNLPEIDIQDFQTELNRFTYFFLAPTLIYRDKYVLSPHRSYKNAFFHFLNFTLCIYFGFVLFKTFCKDQIILLANDFTPSQFVQCLFKLMMPSTFSILLIFFGLLHSWFNGWAELLRFPDRTFYLDWWNSEEFGTYYRQKRITKQTKLIQK